VSLDRDELQDSARKAFGEDGLVPDAAQSWARLVEMGWFMMTVPEDLGGLGMGPEAVGVIHTELGRALVPGSAIAQMVAIEALAGHGDWLERAMAGEPVTVSLCHALDADRAGYSVQVAPGRVTLEPIATATQRDTWDQTRRLFDITTSGDGIVLAEGAEADALADRLRAVLLIALAADSLGAADAILAMTIEYLKVRRQFDRPLALFQALKHRVADLKVALTAAEALFWSCCTPAARLVDLGALKAHATSAALRVAEEAIQLHGGIGLTAEHPCHLFLKRILLNRALGDDSDYWEEAAGRALLDASSRA
jgi:alkylation response protein AidB-like acyl-CoA dehydrogenase